MATFPTFAFITVDFVSVAAVDIPEATVHIETISAIVLRLLVPFIPCLLFGIKY